MRAFLTELRRRGVFRAAVAYAAVVFVVLQVADITLPALGAPPWLLTVIVLASFVAFPAVMALSWLYDFTAGGLRRAEPADTVVGGATADAAEAGGQLFLAAALLVLSLVVIGLSGWWILRSDGGEAGAAASGGATMAGPSVAVLPLAVDGDDEEAVLLAEGVFSEILGGLARVPGLRTIMRSSVESYHAVQLERDAIARELGVRTIVEGQVWHYGSRVRVALRLVEAPGGRQLWADSYVVDATDGVLFELPARVAEQVVQAVTREFGIVAAVAPSGDVPTQNLEAYRFFLVGNASFAARFAEEPTRRAIEMFEQAVALDPAFASAWAMLASANALYFSYFDPSEARARRAIDAHQRARAIAPDAWSTRLAEVYIAHAIHSDLDRAVRLIEAAIAEQPNNAELQWMRGSIERRRGNLQQSIEALGQAVALDPRTPIFHIEAALSLMLAERFAEAEPHYARARELAPDWLVVYVAHATFDTRRGRLEQASVVLSDGAARVGWPTLLASLTSHRLRAGLLALDESIRQQYLDEGERLPADPVARHLTTAQILWIRGDPAARAHFEAARALLEERVRARPGEPIFHGELALALAGLGERAGALAAARRALDLAPHISDEQHRFIWGVNLLNVHVLLGDIDGALDALQRLRNGRFPLWRVELERYPFYESLRRDPRGRALIARW
jgi:TolB-like protein/tetratricopeptide (TPR) repeat protein